MPGFVIGWGGTAISWSITGVWPGLWDHKATPWAFKRLSIRYQWKSRPSRRENRKIRGRPFDFWVVAGYGRFQKIIILRTDFEGKNLARKNLAKKILHCKKISFMAYKAEKNNLTPLYVRKKILTITRGLGKIFLRKPNHSYPTPFKSQMVDS